MDAGLEVPQLLLQVNGSLSPIVLAGKQCPCSAFLTAGEEGEGAVAA